MGHDFVLRMLKIYLKDIPVKIKCIEASFAEDRFDDLRIAIHTLGSHVRDLDAKGVHRQLLALEKKELNVINQGYLMEQIEDLRSSCDQIMDELSIEYERLTGNQGEKR